jgi:hypothetical protein
MAQQHLGSDTETLAAAAFVSRFVLLISVALQHRDVPEACDIISLVQATAAVLCTHH